MPGSKTSALPQKKVKRIRPRSVASELGCSERLQYVYRQKHSHTRRVQDQAALSLGRLAKDYRISQDAAHNEHKRGARVQWKSGLPPQDQDYCPRSPTWPRALHAIIAVPHSNVYDPSSCASNHLESAPGHHRKRPRPELLDVYMAPVPERRGGRNVTRRSIMTTSGAWIPPSRALPSHTHLFPPQTPHPGRAPSQARRDLHRRRPSKVYRRAQIVRAERPTPELLESIQHHLRAPNVEGTRTGERSAACPSVVACHRAVGRWQGLRPERDHTDSAIVSRGARLLDWHHTACSPLHIFSTGWLRVLSTKQRACVITSTQCDPSLKT